jgi:hypothetical protein
MATKKRPGSAKRTLAKQEAARKRGAPGKQFIGETAGQVAKAKRAERKKVARMARAARPAEAARTAGPKRSSQARKAARRPEPTMPENEAAFRAAEQDAAEHGAEVEPIEQAEPLLRAVPAPEQHDGEHDAARLREAAAELGAVTADAWGASSDPDERRAEGAGTASDTTPPLGLSMSDLVRSALGLVRTAVTVPFRIALAIPRLALRAVLG